jgi:hypothetical protein
VVVRDLDFVGMTVLPGKTNSVLLIDADAMFGTFLSVLSYTWQ